MTKRAKRALSELEPAKQARVLAKRVHKRLKLMGGTRQVRLHRGGVLTYPYPAREGYGTRGLMVGIYNATARLKWIEEDLLRVLSGEL
jgi:hypothetical protein